MPDLDLSLLPAPDAVETIEFELLAQQWRTELATRNPAFTSIVESDPAYQEMDVGAYREMLLRDRVNLGVKAVMLSHSRSADLDNLAANVNVQRLLIRPGNPDAIPPEPPTYESDDSLRHRAQLKWESITTAGSVESYQYHARSAAGQVRDVYVVSPEPCDIEIYVLSHEGEASPALLSAVDTAVTGKTVRPLGDRVTVLPAERVELRIIAELEVGTGPDAGLIIDRVTAAVMELISPEFAMGLVVDLPSLYAKLKQPGVGRIYLSEPTEDIELQPHQAPNFVEVTITRRGI
ncbi:MAG: baseplate J/gp47 family protein [Marinobacterium sp.]|nr:baseplate J/gp47 family protein [Marinobacterium sp.]